MNERTIRLTPDWRSYFWYYIAGIVLIPLFGIGIAVLWLLHRRRTDTAYEIHDTYIRSLGRDDSQRLDLVTIREISVEQSWTERRFDTGSVVLKAHVSEIQLQGMKRPDDLALMIQQAADAEILRLQDMNKREMKIPDSDPGTLDKIDYLTGLWQQGLISNEDYEKEKKHFET